MPRKGRCVQIYRVSGTCTTGWLAARHACISECNFLFLSIVSFDCIDVSVCIWKNSLRLCWRWQLHTKPSQANPNRYRIFFSLFTSNATIRLGFFFLASVLFTSHWILCFFSLFNEYVMVSDVHVKLEHHTEDSLLLLLLLLLCPWSNVIKNNYCNQL